MKDFKKDFEEWYMLYLREQRIDYYKFTNEQLQRKFYRAQKSMQFGVFCDFFDSVGIYIDIMCAEKRNLPELEKKVMYVVNVGQDFGNIRYKTRQEAREKAIEKAIEIYSKTK